MKKFTSLFVVLAILSPMIAVAGTKVDDWERVMALKPGTEVSLQTTDGKILSGRIGDTWRNGLTLFTEKLEIIRVSRDDVLLVWKPRKRDIRLPVWIGVGVGVGGTAGYIFGKGAETEADREEDPGLVPLIGTCTGSVVGATVGLLIGLAKNLPGNKILYQSKGWDAPNHK